MISFLIFIKIVFLFIIVFAIRRKVRKRPSEPGRPFTMPRSRERTSDFSVQRDVMQNDEIPAEDSVLYSLSSVACFHDKLLRWCCFVR